MANINYFNVVIPEKKKPKNYTYIERRAEMLKLIMRAGHPRAINQSEICKRYGVTQGQISQDITAIAEALKDQSKGDIELISEAVYQSSILKLQKEGKHYKAAKVVEMWNGWLFNSGKLSKAPEKLEVKTEDAAEYAKIKKDYDNILQKQKNRTPKKSSKK